MFVIDMDSSWTQSWKEEFRVHKLYFLISKPELLLQPRVRLSHLTSCTDQIICVEEAEISSNTHMHDVNLAKRRFLLVQGGTVVDYSSYIVYLQCY